ACFVCNTTRRRTLTLTGRGERMRASGPVERVVRRLAEFVAAHTGCEERRHRCIGHRTIPRASPGCSTTTAFSARHLAAGVLEARRYCCTASSKRTLSAASMDLT